jgi:predicted CXXCH cytochrome family protein
MARGVANRHVDASHWFSSLGSRVPVVSPSGTIPGTGGTSDNQVFCGSCHKAHGSSHRAGLIFDDETTAIPEDGTSLVQTCQQCHYQ